MMSIAVRFIALCALLTGMVLSLRFYWETVHGIYPWADHMPALGMLTTALAYWLISHAATCFERS